MIAALAMELEFCLYFTLNVPCVYAIRNEALQFSPQADSASLVPTGPAQVENSPKGNAMEKTNTPGEHRNSSVNELFGAHAVLRVQVVYKNPSCGCCARLLPQAAVSLSM